MKPTGDSITIAIVGHGRSPEGKGWGKRIDSCEYVIRMWNWYWQDEADYGTKYDYGVLEDPQGILRNFEKFNQHEPTCGYVVSQLNHRIMPNFPPKTILVDQQPWTEIGVQLGGMGATGRLQFTRGTVAACWAIESARRGDRIILVGFDNVYERTALSIEKGFAAKWQKDPTNYWSGYTEGRRYGNHDFAIENPVLQHLAAKHGVTVVYSQDAWQ